MGSALHDLLGLGLEPKNLTALHVTLRSIIVFLVTLMIVRVGNKAVPFWHVGVRRDCGVYSGVSPRACGERFGRFLPHSGRWIRSGSPASVACDGGVPWKKFENWSKATRTS